jgi:hypothetical protein
MNQFSWQFWPVLPIYPYGKRRTIRKELVKDTIWTFDQLQGIFYVVVPVRMTVVKLEEGGLLVYAPVAPTPECVNLVRELVAEHGEIKYIILPTISGLEHKVFVGPFARKFPQAKVFVAPNQWSFPLNLPLSWLGLPPKRTYILPENSSQTPFANEFDCAILGPIDLKSGYFEEVAFYHKRSRTLLVTDTIVSISEDPPAIVELDSYPLLFHARDSAAEILEDNRYNRRKGWQRICLFALYFRPRVLKEINWLKVIKDVFRAPDRSKNAYFGIFPFEWESNWQNSFEALSAKNSLLVAPVLQTLILNRAPQETLLWVERVTSWNFERIIPCHFSAPIATHPARFREAFAFLEKKSTLPEDDFQLLKQLNEILSKTLIIHPPQ